MTSVSALEHEINALVDWAAGREQSKGHVGVSKWLAVEEVLVANLNADSLIQLAKLLDWDLHVLALPMRVFAAIDTSGRPPFLTLTNDDADEWVLFVQWTTTVNIQVSALNDESQPAGPWDHETTTLNHDLWLLRSDHNLRLLDNNLWLLDDNSWTTHAWGRHTNELGPHVNKTTCVELDELLTWTVAGEDTKRHGCLSNFLQGVSLVLDNNSHIVLEHVGGNFHEL